MMKTSIVGDDCTVFNDLCEIGVPQKRAIQLQNMFNWAGYKSAVYLTSTDSKVEVSELNDRTVCFVTPDYPMEQTLKLCATCAESEAVLCILKPYDSRLRSKACLDIIRTHKHTSVDMFSKIRQMMKKMCPIRNVFFNRNVRTAMGHTKTVEYIVIISI